jgi:hypothetical protein
MSTTNLFVELVVIGVGTLAWIVLLVLALFGWNWVPVEQLFSPTAVIPLLAVVYLLGIITDRLADALFDRWWSPRLRQAEFPRHEDYHQARHEILMRSERLAELLEYGRSRLRICRGWSLNALLIALAAALLLLRVPERALQLGAFVVIGCLAVAAGAAYAWRQLATTQYRKVREQATMLRQQHAAAAAIQHEVERALRAHVNA